VPGDFSLRKDDIRPNPAHTPLLRQMIGIPLRIHARRVRTAAKVLLGIAPITLLHILSQPLRGASLRVAREHAEAGTEGRGCVWAGRGVVDGDAGVVALVELVCDLGDALVAAVAGAEVEVCGPVVGEVFVEEAGRAGCELGNVAHGHGGLERVLVGGLVRSSGEGVGWGGGGVLRLRSGACVLMASGRGSRACGC